MAHRRGATTDMDIRIHSRAPTTPSTDRGHTVHRRGATTDMDIRIHSRAPTTPSTDRGHTVHRRGATTDMAIRIHSRAPTTPTVQTGVIQYIGEAPLPKWLSGSTAGPPPHLVQYSTDRGHTVHQYQVFVILSFTLCGKVRSWALASSFVEQSQNLMRNAKLCIKNMSGGKL